MKELDELVGNIYSTTVTEVAVLVREVRIRIGVLPDFVTVWIYYDPRGSEPYRFELSARVMPVTADAPDFSVQRAASEGDALRRAVRILTFEYEEAVRQGHMPDDSWLVRTKR